MKKIAIIGASGHGKVIADIAVKNDDNKTIRECAGFPIIGTVDKVNSLACDKIVAIGNAKIRRSIQEKINHVVTLIHPNAVISRRVQIAEGTVVMAGAVINSDVTIGKGCIINTGASVDHDCHIGSFVHVSVGAHVAGTCDIGDETWIGAGATVSNNVNICSECTVGAGAVVVKNLNNSGTYMGVPAEEKIMKNTKNIFFGGGYVSRVLPYKKMTFEMLHRERGVA